MHLYQKQKSPLIKLAIFLIFTLLVTQISPAFVTTTSAAPSRPTLEQRYRYSYSNTSNTYILLALKKGYRIDWTISNNAKGVVSFSKTDKNQITKTVHVTSSTSKTKIYTYNVSKKEAGTSYEVTASVYDASGKKITTCKDSVILTCDALKVIIPDKPTDDTMHLGTSFDFNYKLLPSYSTNKTFWLVTDENKKVIINTKKRITSYKASIDKNGVFIPKVAGTYILTAQAYRNISDTILRAESSPITIKVPFTTDPTPTIAPTPTPSITPTPTPIVASTNSTIISIPQIVITATPTASPTPEPTANPEETITTSSLTGKVYASDSDRDFSNNPALGGSLVTLTQSDTAGSDYHFETTTDSDGNYAITNIPASTYIFEISKEDYIIYHNESYLIAGDGNVENVFLDVANQAASLAGIVTVADEDTDAMNNLPVAEITVTMRKIGSNTTVVRNIATNETGHYTFDNLPLGVYEISVSDTRFIPIISEITIDTVNTTHYNIMLEAISSSSLEDGSAKGTIYNSLTGHGVEAGLTLKIMKGYNLSTVDVCATTITDENGSYSLSLPSGNYTVYVSDERTDVTTKYRSGRFSIKVIGNKTISNQNGEVTPILENGEIRIVLVWGSTPNDLDSHLSGPTPDQGSFHTYYSNKNYSSGGNTFIQLDVDDTSSYGPETTTIYTQSEGIYKFSVHDYTNRGQSSSTALANSGAYVKVYEGDRMISYYVPNIEGTAWDVFEYDSVSGVFTTLNNMYYANDPTTVGTTSRMLRSITRDAVFEDADQTLKDYEKEEVPIDNSQTDTNADVDSNTTDLNRQEK